jgi:broad-specificity NMP kinase
MNIVLIGMRGVGKTNIARRISFQTKRPVMSTDVLVEYETGQSIPAFVAEHGWTAFRDAEHEVVGKLSRLDDLIIDDPYKNAQEARSPAVNVMLRDWWQQVVLSRLNPDANVVVMFHRWWEGDFAGWLIEQGC